MALRKGHGNGAGSPRVEVLPADELPRGVAGDVHAERTGERTARGTWVQGAHTQQSAGGRARAGTTRLARRLGLATIAEGAEWAPYARSAEDFRRAQCSTIAATVGGGLCGPGPSSMIASAALQLAASRLLFDRAAATGDDAALRAASSLANDSRQNLLAAHELAAREAKARPRPAAGAPWLAASEPAATRPADAPEGAAAPGDATETPDATTGLPGAAEVSP